MILEDKFSSQKTQEINIFFDQKHFRNKSLEDTEAGAGAGGQRMENMVWTAFSLQVLNRRVLHLAAQLYFFREVNVLATKKWPLDVSSILENNTVPSHYVNICRRLVY